MKTLNQRPYLALSIAVVLGTITTLCMSEDPPSADNPPDYNSFLRDPIPEDFELPATATQSEKKDECDVALAYFLGSQDSLGNWSGGEVDFWTEMARPQHVQEINQLSSSAQQLLADLPDDHPNRAAVIANASYAQNAATNAQQRLSTWGTFGTSSCDFFHEQMVYFVGLALDHYDLEQYDEALEDFETARGWLQDRVEMEGGYGVQQDPDGDGELEMVWYHGVLGYLLIGEDYLETAQNAFNSY